MSDPALTKGGRQTCTWRYRVKTVSTQLVNQLKNSLMIMRLSKCHENKMAAVGELQLSTKKQTAVRYWFYVYNNNK